MVTVVPDNVTYFVRDYQRALPLTEALRLVRQFDAAAYKVRNSELVRLKGSLRDGDVTTALNPLNGYLAPFPELDCPVNRTFPLGAEKRCA